MTDGTTDVFGAGGEDLFAGDFPDPEAPEATETPEAPAPEAPAEQPEEAPEPEAPAPEETPEQPKAEAPLEEQPLIGGKFKSTDDLLVAYENAQRMATQRAQSEARTRAQMEQLRQQNAATAQVLKELEPVLRGLQTGEIEAPAGFDVENPQQVQALIDRQVERKLQERLAPLQQQQEQALIETRMAEIQKFRSAHPDATPHEEAISFVVQEYRFDPDTNEEVFPPTADNLEVAYTLATRPDVKALVDEVLDVPEPDVVNRAKDALDDPNLAEIVRGMPEVLLRPAGMAFARRVAGLPAVVTTAQSKATEAQKQAAEAQRKAAHVEVDQEVSSVGSAPGKPLDFLDEAVREDQARRRDSVFF